MATVWAYRFGEYIADPSTGWSHAIHFYDLKNLMKEMDKNHLIGKVTRLGILAHGDQGGLVKLEQDLTPKTICNFARSIGSLGLYLTLQGQLVFYSCIAGWGHEGSALLIEISKLLYGRTIVGFDILGMGTKPGLPGKPGQVEVAASTAGAEVAWSLGYRFDIYGDHAKWALNGQIIRGPRDERMARSYYCTNPKCPGHSKDYLSNFHPPCPGYKRVMNPCANPKCPGHKSLKDVCDGWYELKAIQKAVWDKCR